MGDDQFFKTLLKEFLKEFLELFFPDAAKRLDLTAPVNPDEELFQGFPDALPREPDVVAEVFTRKGAKVLVHIEVQARTRGDPGPRMFEYGALLRLSHRLDVFPILLQLRGGRTGIERAVHRQEFFGDTSLHFEYHRVALARLSAWEYVDKSPLGAGLAALMRRGKSSNALKLRLRMLTRIEEAELGETRERLLMDWVGTYFPLSEEEHEEFKRIAEKEGLMKAQEMELTWLERAELKGQEKGIVEGKRETLKRQLTAKFGPLPNEVEARIERIDSSQELDGYLDRVLTAESLEDIGLQT